jgi:WD40 repeat protein
MTVRVWDATSGVEVLTLQGHEHPVMSVAISPDGTRIISGSYNNNKRIWDAVSGLQLSSSNESISWFSSEIEIVDETNQNKFSKIPAIVKTRFWLLEHLTVRYWFSSFRSQIPGQDDDEHKHL